MTTPKKTCFEYKIFFPGLIKRNVPNKALQLPNSATKNFETPFHPIFQNLLISGNIMKSLQLFFFLLQIHITIKLNNGHTEKYPINYQFQGYRNRYFLIDLESGYFNFCIVVSRRLCYHRVSHIKMGKVIWL